ncbi:hypothetical protein F4823DRAFT_634856 [Ustulina deusta]|nr:hypothetical protein F4823DRAFT_634856 [Ustulina deusta]
MSLRDGLGKHRMHLLRAPLDHEEVAHIFYVSRGEDGGRAMQCNSFTDNGFVMAALNSYVPFIKADLQQAFLGLDDNTSSSSRPCSYEWERSAPPLEEVLENFGIPSPFGYGWTKFIAVATRDLNSLALATIPRVGQVAGLWNPKEWFPSMALSCLRSWLDVKRALAASHFLFGLKPVGVG